MFGIQCFNTISEVGLNTLPKETYRFTDNNPDAILLRSYKLHDIEINDSLKAVARAGAGTNNIPVDKLQSLGIPVFNTPGANANAVKELVIAALFLAARNICPAWLAASKLEGSDVDLQVENLKKEFSGSELPNKVLGIIGLGAIGVLVANAAISLDMNVIAYDPCITIENAWQLSAMVKQAHSIEEILPQVDYLSVHVPYNDSTHHLINQQRLKHLKPSAVVLNFSRAAIVDDQAILQQLKAKQLNAFVTDFPSEPLLNQDRVIALPHLGASTSEAEENCALMAVNSLRAYLEYGNIQNSVNFPNVNLSKPKGYRAAIVNKNIPNMLGQISSCFASHKLNIIDMINKSRGGIAYTLLDIDQEIQPSVFESLKQIDGVIKCRYIEQLD